MIEFIKSLDGFNGDARVYLANGQYVMVSRADTFDRGDETMIFPWDEVNGLVSDWGDLYAGYGETHLTALTSWIAED